MADPTAVDQSAMEPTQPAPTQEDANILSRLKDLGLNRRKTFMDVFEEAEYFSYSKDYDSRLYTAEAKSADYVFKAKLNKAAEFVEVIGPYLFPRVPDAQVNPKKWSTYWARKRHQVEEDYLDYALWEGDFQGHMRKTISEACLSGRSCLQVGYNDKKKIVQSTYRSCRDLIIDPDAKSSEEVNWIAIRRVKPKWEMKALIAKVRGDNSMDDAIDSAPAYSETAEGTKSHDVVEYWEFYLTVGLWRFGDTLLGQSPGEDGQLVQDDSPRKYYWMPGHVLAESEWEIPFFLIDEWPVSWLDLRPRPNSLWPVSPLEPGLGHLKAANYLYTFYINRQRVASRMFLVAADYNGQGVTDDQLMKFVYEDDLGFIRIKINGNELKINDLVQQFKFDAGIQEFERAFTLLMGEFSKATALSDILYAGEGQRQSRIKADVDFKEEKSQSRINDMRNRVMDYMSRVMRKMAFAARFLEKPEDIAAKLGPEAGSVWGVLASPEQVKQQQMQRDQQKQITKQALQAQARQAQMMQQQAAQMNPGMPPPAPIPPPSDEELEGMLGPEPLVNMEEWTSEADRTIDAGTARSMDIDAKLDNVRAILTQYSAVLGNMPAGPLALATAYQELAKLSQFSLSAQDAAKKMVEVAASMTPPPGMPPAGPPQGGMPSPPANQNPNGRPPGSPE